MSEQRAKLENALNDDDSDYSDGDEEQPQIVVVKSGDLTAAEAETERLRIEAGESLDSYYLLLIRFFVFFCYIFKTLKTIYTVICFTCYES